MKESYLNVKTDLVGSFDAYEKDFTNFGDFEKIVDSDDDFLGKADGKDKVTLRSFLSPGQYNGETWVICEQVSLSSYLIELRYINQDYVKIKFLANGIWESCSKSFELLKSAAKKFFLLSEFVLEQKKHNLFSMDEPFEPLTDIPGKKKGHHLFPPGVEPSWEKIEEFIASISSQKERSWRKTMTVIEARELFEFLKIKIEFPS